METRSHLLCLKGPGPWGSAGAVYGFAYKAAGLRRNGSLLWMSKPGFPDFPDFSALVAGRGEGVTGMGPEGAREGEKVVHIHPSSGGELLPKDHT